MDNIDFKIYGNDIQTLEIILKPGEVIKADPGAMLYMEHGIEMETKFFDKGDGFLEKLGKVVKRYISGESLQIVYFENKSSTNKKLGLASEVIGKIIPLLLEKGEPFYVQTGSHLASTKNIDIDIEVIKKLSVGFLGGEGFVLQKLTGPGIIFLNSFGYIHEIELNNKEIYVDTGALVGFTEGISYEIIINKGIKNILFSGEGIALAKLSGAGTVYIQNITLQQFAGRIAKEIQNNRSGYNDGKSSLDIFDFSN